MKSIKVPAAIMDVFYEAEACEQLAKDSGFLKAIYYKQRDVKAKVIAWRALNAAHPETKIGAWTVSNITGLATLDEPATEPKPKKQRKPKVVVPAVTPTPTEGASK